MKFLPILKPGIANLWILLLIYLVVFLIFVIQLSKGKRDWLFADPKEEIHGIKKLTLRVGQLLSFIFIILLCLSPFPYDLWGITIIGMSFYVLGTVLVPVSLHYFGQAPDHQPVLNGPYRFSRNPQWVGLFFVLLGMAICSHSWLLIMMVVLIGLIYHIQILEEEKVCLIKYGATYQQYLQSVPRYLFII